MKTLQYLTTIKPVIKVSSIIYDIRVKVVSCTNITINFSTSLDDNLEIIETNGVIHIQSEYEKQKIQFRGNYEGYIELLIPRSVVELSCNSVDSRVSLTCEDDISLLLKKLNINVVNGIIEIEHMNSTCHTSLNAVDGSIKITRSLMKSLSINNVSSCIYLHDAKFNSASIHMVSGECHIEQEVNAPRIHVKKTTMFGSYINSAVNDSEIFALLKFSGVRGNLRITNIKM